MADKGDKALAAEVGIRMVIDTNAKAATEALKGAFGQISAKAKAEGITAGGLLTKGAMGAATLLKGGLMMHVAAATAGVGAVIGLAHKAKDAFEESAAQVKELAGTLTILDQKNNAWGDVKEYAGDLKNELEEIAIQLGTTDDAAVQMFTHVVERGARSVEEAKKLTGEMIIAGRALPGGAESIAQGFSMMQMGMTRARNPVVQLIAATHTMKGSAKEVAKELQKMPIEKQLEKAEEAIGKMSAKMRDVPMTMGQMKKSMGVVWGNLFEDAGETITKGMKPFVQRAYDLLLGNRDALTGVAKEFGDNVAKGLDFAFGVADELIKAIQANWGDIESAFKEMREVIEPVFKYIYENKGTFAKTFADLAVLLIKAATWIMKAMATVYSTIGSVAKTIGKSGMLGEGLADFIGDEEREEQRKKMSSRVKEFGPGASMSPEEYNRLRQQYVATAEGTKKASTAGSDFDASYRRAMDDHLATMKSVEGARDAALTDDASKYGKMFDIAAKANDQAAMIYVAKFLEGNTSLQNALIKAGPDVLKSFDQLKTVLGNLGEKELVDKLGGKKIDLGIAAKGGITQNFNGPINVKQDFRDQDPDRVAMVFKEEMGRVGSNRLQSMFSTMGPMGTR